MLYGVKLRRHIIWTSIGDLRFDCSVGCNVQLGRQILVVQRGAVSSSSASLP
jgi:hypothetical protein